MTSNNWIKVHCCLCLLLYGGATHGKCNWVHILLWYHGVSILVRPGPETILVGHGNPVEGCRSQAEISVVSWNGDGEERSH